MAFCQKCGTELVPGAKFCANCGTPSGETGNENERKQTYDGEIKKCPSCGAVLPSGVTKCSSCGYELRNIQAVESVTEFCAVYTSIDDSSKADIIRSYPIPNAKEDFLEFLLMAKTEVELPFKGGPSKGLQTIIQGANYSQEIHDAWVSKFLQLKSKAPILFLNDPKTLSQVEKIIKETKIRKYSNYTKQMIIMGIIFVGFLVVTFIGSLWWTLKGM